MSDTERWTFIDKTGERDDEEEKEPREPPKGIVLYTEDGEPVRVTLMDENDDWLKVGTNPEQGVFGYENRENAVTMFLEEP